MEVWDRPSSFAQLKLRPMLFYYLRRSRQISKSCMEISLKIRERSLLRDSKSKSSASWWLRTLPQEVLIFQMSIWSFKSSHQKILRPTSIEQEELPELAKPVPASPSGP